MFWIRAYKLRGEVGGGWALEFPSFLGPVKWERADRRVPFWGPYLRIPYPVPGGPKIYGSDRNTAINIDKL
jgi:hypothetical protein